MKVTFEDGVRTRSGHVKGMKYCYMYFEKYGVSYARRYKVPKYTETNAIAGNKMRATVDLWHQVPEGFKDDLKKYVREYNKKHLEEMTSGLSGYNIFVKVVFPRALEINSLEELVETFGNTVLEWIERNYLRRVRYYQSLKAKLVA
jgi:hypothetical protein